MSKQIITLANDMTAFFQALPNDGQGKTGQIFAANDANFDAQYLSDPLNEYIVGVRDDQNLQEFLDRAAPMVPSGRSFTYRQHDSKEAFQADAADNKDVREIGGDFAQVKRTGTQQDGRTDNKGLTMVIDDDQGGGLASVQQMAVVNLRDRLLRSEIIRLEVGLEANDTAATPNWGPANATADPDSDIEEMIDLSGDERGVDANVIILGGGAWLKRRRAIRRSDTTGAKESIGLSLEEMAAYFGVDSVLRAKMRFQSSATAKTKVVADKVYAYYAQPGLMNDDASNVKRFVTMTAGGPFQVYTERRLKKWLITVEHYSRIIVTSNVGIRKLGVTYTS
jgi:hypothetical protein